MTQHRTARCIIILSDSALAPGWCSCPTDENRDVSRSIAPPWSEFDSCVNTPRTAQSLTDASYTDFLCSYLAFSTSAAIAGFAEA